MGTRRRPPETCAPHSFLAFSFLAHSLTLSILEHTPWALQTPCKSQRGGCLPIEQPPAGRPGRLPVSSMADDHAALERSRAWAAGGLSVHARARKGLAALVLAAGELPIPPRQAYELMSHPDNAAIFRGIERCTYRRVLWAAADCGRPGDGRQTVEVENESGAWGSGPCRGQGGRWGGLGARGLAAAAAARVPARDTSRARSPLLGRAPRLACARCLPAAALPPAACADLLWPNDELLQPAGCHAALRAAAANPRMHARAARAPTRPRLNPNPGGPNPKPAPPPRRPTGRRLALFVLQGLDPHPHAGARRPHCLHDPRAPGARRRQRAPAAPQRPLALRAGCAPAGLRLHCVDEAAAVAGGCGDPGAHGATPGCMCPLCTPPPRRRRCCNPRPARRTLRA